MAGSAAFATIGFGDAGSVAAAVGGGASQPATPTAAPPTVGKFAERCAVPQDVANALVTALGGDLEMSLEDFVFMSLEAVTNAVSGLTMDEAPASELRKSQAMKLFRKAQVAGIEAGLPLLGTTLQPQPVTKVVAETPKVEDATVMLKCSTFLDQASEASFPLLAPDKVRQLRGVYRNLFGDDPTTAARPTDEQLSALSARLASGRVPFVDFAVFGPFDDHAAKLRKYSDQAFVGGVLQTRLLAGPSTYADWSACFEVFKVSMIMLEAAKPGSLARYEEGIRQLWHTFGTWSIIEQADVAMRSREWSIVRDDLEAEGWNGCDPNKPWDAVIARTRVSPSVARGG